MTRRLVIDCDPGCDDALAILLALRSTSYGCIDIVTVAGNVGINQATTNAVRIVALGKCYGLGVKKTVTIHRGAAASLRGNEPSAASVHGRDGLGDAPLRALISEELRETFFREVSSLPVQPPTMSPYREATQDKAVERPDLLCIGPLTNVAHALLQLPRASRHEFWSRWRRVVVMCGAFFVPGNVSYSAEFNAHADPEALLVVLESWNRHLAHKSQDATPLVVVPLDVTESVTLAGPEKLKGETPLAAAVYCLLRKYFLFHALNYDPPQGSPRTKGQVADDYKKARLTASAGLKTLPKWCYLHDPTAFCVLDSWDRIGLICSSEDCYVRLDRSDGESRGLIHRAGPRSFFNADQPHDRGDLQIVRAVTSGDCGIRDSVQDALKGLLSH